MRRRHLVVLVSAAALLTAVFIAAVTIGVGVGTDPGRETIRSLIEQQVGGRVKGKIHIGTIAGGFLGGITIDTFAIRGEDDSLLVTTGRIKADYDLRDILDRRLLLRNVEIAHLYVRLEQFEKGDWNFERIFKGDGGPSAPDVPGRSFGDFVVLENVRGGDANVILVRPWHPNEMLTGVKRDSAIAYNLSRKDKEIRRGREGFTHVYRWTKASAVLPRIRLADPDSNRFGQLITFESLKAEEQEPPFSFSNMSGAVRKQGDSLFLDVKHFDLPASTGSARGKIWWGSKLPTRLDIMVRGDSVALNDIAWVYPTLPRTGSGRTNLRIRNYPDNLRDFQYELIGMDARSTRSRLVGDMTFVSSGPILRILDVDLQAAPVNFDLVRTLAGEPLPVDWQGDLWGYVRGPGGLLTNFVVAESDVTFRDAHVPGAVTRASGRGELDILDPEFTAFHGFQVNAQVIDLRSIEYLFPAFPRIGGTVSGVATLDSIWTDVRFSKADMTHRNMPGEPSRVTGSGRVTYGEQFMSFDVNVNAQPLSLTMMSHAYDLGIKGLMSGPIQAKGTSNDLQLTARLEGPAGRIAYSGRADAYPLSVAARGGGRVDNLDLSQFVDKPNVPSGWVTGTYQLDVRYDTTDFGTLTGMAAAQIERAELDSNRIFPSRLRARFAGGRAYVDTLRVESAAATLTASGAIGITTRSDDSLQYQIAVDSLGGLRRYVSQLMTAWEKPEAAADSLGGTILVSGVARGALASLDLAGTVTGSELFIRRGAGKQLTGAFDLANLNAGPTGSLGLQLKTLNVGVIALDTLGFQAKFAADGKSGFSLGALASNGVTFALGGDVARADSVTDLVVRQLTVVTDSTTWSLQRATPIRLAGRGITIDSLAITNGSGGSIVVEGVVPDTGKSRMVVRADSVSLHDVARVAQLHTPISGWGHFSLQGAGTSLSPVMNAQARLNSVHYGTMVLNTVTASALYANRRADVELDIARGTRPEVLARASLPIELKYFGAQLLDDSLHGTVRTDSASVELLEMFLPLSRGSGKLVANLDIAGSWKHPDLSGPIRVENGEATLDSLGIKLQGINVDIALFGHADSLHIKRFAAWSGTSAADSASLSGYIGYKRIEDPNLSLRLVAHTFRAFDKRSVARLDVSTEPGGLTLRGRLKDAELRGGVVVDRGSIFLPDPELARKQTVGFATLSDSTINVNGNGGVSSSLLNYITMNGVRLTLGDEVYLRSAREANIKLTGSLNVQLARTIRREVGTLRETEESEPVLDGVLRAERGTYSLALDPTGLLVRREFQVEGGTVTFFGTSQLDEEINITALHTLRTANGDDLRIRVRITGSARNPVVVLESANSFQLSQSDMVSYLIFGQPNFELGAAGQTYVQMGLRTVYPTLQEAFRNTAGLFLPSAIADVLVFRPAYDLTSAFSGTTQWNSTTLFEGSRLGAEKQFGERWFFSVSTPVCFVDQSEQAQVLYQGLSGRIEWRMSRDASIRAGKEPSAQVCGRITTGRVVQTPSQLGLSVLKSWRF